MFEGRLQNNTSPFYTVPYLDRFFFFTARTALVQASSCRFAEGWKKLVLISLPSVPNICQKQNCDLGPISPSFSPCSLALLLFLLLNPPPAEAQRRLREGDFHSFYSHFKTLYSCHRSSKLQHKTRTQKQPRKT